jgi:hypothetical protein
MSAWGKTDNLEDKPHWPVERTSRVATQATANIATYALNGAGAIVTANANTLYFQSTAGIYPGQNVTQIISGALTSSLAFNSGEGGFFHGNVTVASVTTGTVTLAPASGTAAGLRGNVAVGDIFVFGNAIAYHTGTYETTYWKDTVLTTNTRTANATVAVTRGNVGWQHVRKKINNDGTVRYLTETLVALADPVASNTSSGDTSNTQVYTGV